MKTIKLNVYQYSELSRDIKERLATQYNDGEDYQYLWNEYIDTLTAFKNLTDFDDNNAQKYELSGLRLRTWLINNIGNDIVEGRYFSLWSKTDFNNHKNPKLKYRHSKITFDRNCPLTGICWDYSLLSPLYEFIYEYSKEKHSGTLLNALLDDCLNSLKNDIEAEIEARQEIDNLIDHFEANHSEQYFTENGMQVDLTIQ